MDVLKRQVERLTQNGSANTESPVRGVLGVLGSA